MRDEKEEIKKLLWVKRPGDIGLKVIPPVTAHTAFERAQPPKAKAIGKSTTEIGRYILKAKEKKGADGDKKEGS